MKNKDSLLQCLVIFTRLHNRPFSSDALVADLPVEEGRTTPRLFSIDSEKSKSSFSRAALRGGFHSKLVRYQLSEISKLLLPVILNLKDDKACILTKFSKDKEYAKVIIPEYGDDSGNWIKLSDLEDEYVGYAFLVKPIDSHTDVQKRVLKHEKHHWFWGTVKYSRAIYFDVIIASFLINLFALASPLFTMNIYDRVVPNNAVDTMWVLAVGVIVIYTFDMLLKFLRAYFLEKAAKKSDIIMSSIIYEKVLNLKMSAKPSSVGSFASNLKDFDSIRGFFASSTIAAMVDLPFAVVFIFVIYLVGDSLAFIPMTTAVIIIIYSFILEKPLRRSIESTYEASAHKNAVLIETLTGLETIKAMGISGQSQWKWEEATGEIANKGLRSRIITNSITTFVNYAVQINTVALIIAGVYAIGDKTLSMGALIAVVMLGSRTLAPLGQVASLVANFQQTKTAFDALDNIMNLPVEREEGKKFVTRPNFKGKIEFKDVTFTYPGTDNAILKNVSFVISAGEAVGIIGTNGSGKSTIEKLIIGLYEPDNGSILIDDIDINQIDPADLRRNISYVPQDIMLFQGSVKQNIVARIPDASDEQLLEAANISGVGNFINRHPLGFDMVVGERGEMLSGGQRQAIGVARALIEVSPILLFDEPTNAMDSVNEAKLINTISEFKKKHTLIMISHKNNLLNLADRLILIDNGMVALDGTKQAVIEQLNNPNKKSKL